MEEETIGGVATCPSCGFKNRLRYNATKVPYGDVILCDCEEGGCNKYFAILINRPVLVINSFEMKPREIPVNDEKA